MSFIQAPRLLTDADTIQVRLHRARRLLHRHALSVCQAQDETDAGGCQHQVYSIEFSGRSDGRRLSIMVGSRLGLLNRFI